MAIFTQQFYTARGTSRRREAAAALPKETDEPERLDDTVDLGAGEVVDDADSDAVLEGDKA